MLALNRLDRRDCTTLIAQIAGKTLPGEVVFAIAERTDGVPLFIEELTKSVLESGLLRRENDRYALDRALPPLAIPATLHASLLARLDRLASARRLAQIGAAIGRQFSCALLRAVSRLPEDELQAAFGQLVASELVFQRGTPPEAVYTFKHALVQDVAHGSLLRNARQQLHAQIAEALEAHSPEIIESQPELLAQHYAEAGLVEKAVAFWGKAGHRSVARSAMAEAAAQFQKGLDQLAMLPDIPERRQQELEFSSALGAVLNVVKGSAAPETGQAYARARELWEQLGSPVEFIQVPCGQSRYHAHRGELDVALRLDQDLLRRSRRRDDSAGLVMGHYSAGRNLMWVGSFASSRSHLEKVLALYDTNSDNPLVRQTGVHRSWQHRRLWGLSSLSRLSRPGIGTEQQGNRRGAETAHPPTLAMSLGMDAFCCRSWATTWAWSSGRTAGCGRDRSGFPFLSCNGSDLSWVGQGKNADVRSLSLLRAGSSAYCGTGPRPGALVYRPPGRGMSDRRSNRRRRGPDGSGVAACRKNGGALVRGRAEPTQGRVAVAAGAYRGCRGVVWQSPRHCPGAGSQALGIATAASPPGCGATRVAAPQPATCSIRSTAGSPRASIPRPSRSAGAARSTGCVADCSLGPDNLVRGKRPVMCRFSDAGNDKARHALGAAGV